MMIYSPACERGELVLGASKEQNKRIAFQSQALITSKRSRRKRVRCTHARTPKIRKMVKILSTENA